MLSKLHITQTFGLIGMETTAARLRMQSAAARLSIERTATRMEIESRLSKVKIDQTQCFAESGLKTPLELARTFYQNSVKMGLEAINTIASEGLKMLGVERDNKAIQHIAAQRGLHPKQLVTTSMPKSRPKMEWDPGFVHIRWEMGSVNIQWNLQDVRYEYVPSSVRVYMLREPSIEITVDEGQEFGIQIPRSGVGHEVDKRL